MLDTIKAELLESQRVLERFLSDPTKLESIKEAATLFADTIKAGNKIFACGNGGSHCDAMHFAEELSGRYREGRPALPALAISDPSHITCVGNDYGYPYIFSRYLEGLSQQGDALLAISTSGNSANVCQAARTARKQGMRVVALTGKDGGELGPLADVEVRVEHQGYADRVQEIHIKVIHIFILLIEQEVL